MSSSAAIISHLAVFFTLKLEPTGTALIGAFDFVGCKDTPHCDGSHLARATDGGDIAASAFRAVDPRIYGAAQLGQFRARSETSLPHSRHLIMAILFSSFVVVNSAHR